MEGEQTVACLLAETKAEIRTQSQPDKNRCQSKEYERRNESWPTTPERRNPGQVKCPS
jgi:hypothetical protein